MLTIGGFCMAQLVVLILLLGPLAAGHWWDGFRAYFANDQLSYAAIATNVAQGDYSLVEPLTKTGSLFYPSTWYQFLGTVARVTGIEVAVLWTLLGVLMAAVAIGVVGWTALRLSGRWFAPALPGLLLLTGTLSTFAVGYWYTPISAHAVLWGPYGSLFTLNAENAGLSLAAIAFSLLLLATRARKPNALVLTSAGLIGLLANVQTYTFFTSLALAALWAAVLGVLMRPRQWSVGLSALLLAIVLIAGKSIAALIGPLPMFGLLLASLVPAAVPVWKARPRLIGTAVLLTALAASPQVVRTLTGLVADDPFLRYREASTKDLGVPLGSALIAGLPLLLIWLASALPIARLRERALLALVLAWPAGWIVMTTNDRWGFNQEPYRFWIQFVILGCTLAGILLAVTSNGFGRLQGFQRRIAIAAAAIAAIVWVLSLADLRGWWHFAAQQGVISTVDARATAIRTLVSDRPGLFAGAPCVDPQLLKLLGADRVAHYNKGLAWPDNVEDFEILQDPGRRNVGDAVALRTAGVDYVVADSRCDAQWTFRQQDLITPIGKAEYSVDGQPGVITLMQVLPR